jgi:hydroxymethylglutaryl-CoA synthase
MTRKVGIVGYGAHIPRYRIKVEEIAKTWGADAPSYKRGLELTEKSVPPPDCDAITLAVEAAKRALKRAGIKGSQISSMYIGSESHPYAVKPSGTVVAEAIGAVPFCRCADYEFACKAGTEAMYTTLMIAADTSQGAPGDALEYSASAGAAAFVMGAENIVAEIEYTTSYMTDTPDFWRREHQFYPQHGGRYTGEPAYFKHTTGAAKSLLEKSGTKPSDFQWAVFHQPNGKFPMRVGQMERGRLTPRLGNTYSGASPIGLTAILDVAKPGDRIFMVSYGSGAGSDGFIWRVTERIKEVQNLTTQTFTLLDEKKVYIDYGTYAKFRHKIIKND